MPVVNIKEMAQTGTFKFGESPELTRRLILTVDEPGVDTPVTIVQQVGIDIGSPHPVFLGVPCNQISINENFDNSPYHIEFIAIYDRGETDIEEANPLARRSQWKFETMGQAVPALFHYAGGQQLPLTNSAFDLFEGLTTDEAMCRATVTSNLRNFPVALATAATNRINAQGYLFGNPRTWKCQGITAEYKQEDVAGRVVDYWEVTSVLMFRMSGWDLLLPDMGFNALVGGQKQRVMTFDAENSEFIPSPVPMGLDGNGAQTFGAPALLVRQIYLEANFSSLFGFPP